jgi:large-conductance mechanosensitive channel
MNNTSNIFKEFLSFLKNNNIVSTIIATVLSTHVTELTTSFADNIILPIIYRDGNRDGKPDINSIDNYIFKINGINFKLGKFYIVFTKVLIIFILLFIIKRYITNSY